MSTLGSINIDFFVFTLYDPKYLIVSDNSTWLHIIDKPAIIEITIPGSTRIITFSFIQNAINTFNSNNLKLTCPHGDCTEQTYIDLPDGVYTITVKGSPDTYYKTKYHLKTDRINQRLDKILIDLGFDFNNGGKDTNKTRDTLLDIQIQLMIAEAYIRKEDINSAKLYYNTANTALGKLEKCLE